MLVILHGVDLWHPYLLGQCFQIKIDHRSLKYFLAQQISSPDQNKWVDKLFGYDYEIIYKKGKENVVADALSKKYEEDGPLFSLSFIVLYWLQVVCQDGCKTPKFLSLSTNCNKILQLLEGTLGTMKSFSTKFIGI
jgi:hypothetical protein